MSVYYLVYATDPLTLLVARKNIYWGGNRNGPLRQEPRLLSNAGQVAIPGGGAYGVHGGRREFWEETDINVNRPQVRQYFHFVERPGQEFGERLVDLGGAQAALQKVATPEDVIRIADYGDANLRVGQVDPELFELTAVSDRNLRFGPAVPGRLPAGLEAQLNDLWEWDRNHRTDLLRTAQTGFRYMRGPYDYFKGAVDECRRAG